MCKAVVFSILLTIIAFAISNLAFAETFNVSTTQEFRQALQDAAVNGESDTIILADGTYKTTDDGGGTFTFLDNEDYGLTIQGSSAENVILSGDNTNQVLNLMVINYEITIHLVNISIQNGKSENDGGGIFSEEKLNIENCTISGNSASVSGGGFWSSDATITNSTITDNITDDDDDGGGFFSSNATITNSTISGNFAGGSGGGFSSSDAATITDSTITGNSADVDGGGFKSSGAIIIDSTISDNIADDDGGGFWSWGGGCNHNQQRNNREFCGWSWWRRFVFWHNHNQQHNNREFCE